MCVGGGVSPLFCVVVVCVLVGMLVHCFVLLLYVCWWDVSPLLCVVVVCVLVGVLVHCFVL